MCILEKVFPAIRLIITVCCHCHGENNNALLSLQLSKYTIVLLTIVSMMYIRSSELAFLTNESFLPFDEQLLIYISPSSLTHFLLYSSMVLD